MTWRRAGGSRVTRLQPDQGGDPTYPGEEGSPARDSTYAISEDPRSARSRSSTLGEAPESHGRRGGRHAEDVPRALCKDRGGPDLRARGRKVGETGGRRRQPTEPATGIVKTQT